MEVVVSKKVSNINNPHLRLETYLDLVELISVAYGEQAQPQSNYLVITAEREGIPERKYFGIHPIIEIRDYLKQVKITQIEHSIPGSFVIGSRLWNIKGEGVAMYGREASLFCYNIEDDELRNLMNLVKKSSRDYSIEFAGKKIYGED